MTRSGASRRQFVNALGGLAMAPLLAAAHPGRRPKVRDAGRQPNIVFILADDLGYGDLSLLGRTEYQTPRIDSIGTGGLVLPEAYANSSVCSPTRFALATGRYQYRLRGGLEEPIGGEEQVGLPPDHPTIASELRQAGYRTALVGKWHMGSPPKFGPLKSGYDRFFGIHEGGADYFSHRTSSGNSGPGSLYEGDHLVDRHGYLTDLLTDRAADEIRQAAAERVPLFLSLHYTAPHWPWEGPEDEEVSRRLRSLQNYDGGSETTWANMMRALDQGVGRVLDAIAPAGQTNNTIVIFTSDNGGERFSRVWPFAGMKGQLLEGGIRVPLFISWPGRIAPGSRSDQVIASMDFMPTLLAAAGGRPHKDYPPDGLNLLPQIVERAPPVERPLYWRFKAGEQAAARLGRWKYLKANGHEYLFDLSADRRERANLSKSQPEIFESLKQGWLRWNAAMLPYPTGSYSYSVKGKGNVAEYD